MKNITIYKQSKLHFTDFFPNHNYNRFSQNMFSIYQGRYAIFQALRLLDLAKKDVVLIPSFHCLAMVEPILCYGCKIDFYKIRKDLTTTVEDIKNRITDETKVVFLVHYFGLFQQETEKIKDFLTKKDIFCIEDCAHVIPFIDNKAGSIGDISIFSPRKFLPVMDGAFLRVNNSEISKPKKPAKLPLIKELKIIKNAFEDQLSSSQDNYLKKCYFLIDKKLNKAVSRSEGIQTEIKKSEKPNSHVEFDINLINAQSSIFTSILLKYSEFKGIYRKRRQFFQFFYSEIYDGTGLKPPEFITSEESTCVLGFPILTDNKKAFIHELKTRKIPHFTFGEQLYQHSNRKEYIMPDDQLTNHLLFIPMHQGLDNEKLRYIAQNTKQILLNLRG